MYNELHPLGKFPGSVKEARVTLAYQSEDDLDAIFIIETEHGEIKCKHPLYDKENVSVSTLDQTREVCALFDLELPDDIDLINTHELVGKSVEVRVREFNGKPYGKINTHHTASQEDIDKAILRFKAGKGKIPF